MNVYEDTPTNNLGIRNKAQVLFGILRSKFDGKWSHQHATESHPKCNVLKCIVNGTAGDIARQIYRYLAGRQRSTVTVDSTVTWETMAY